MNLGLEAGDAIGQPRLKVLVVERQIIDLDKAENDLVLRELGERLSELAIERPAAIAADNDADLESGRGDTCLAITFDTQTDS
jgi:hypothetical protein